MNLPSLNLSKVRAAKQPPVYGKYGQHHSARTNRDQLYAMPNSHISAGMYKIPQNRQVPYGFGGNRKRSGQQQTSFAGHSNFSFTSNHHRRRRNRKEHSHQAYAQHISPKRKHHHKPIVDNKKSKPYRNRIYKSENVENSGGGGVFGP